LYEQIKSAISPTGRVLVMGYPQIWPADHPGCRGTPQFQNAGPFGGTDQLWMNQRLSELNSIIAYEALVVAGVEYVDVSNAFSGHELCAGSSYMNAIDLRAPTKYSFHPNADGQNAFYQTVLSYLQTHTYAASPRIAHPASAAGVAPHLPPVVRVSDSPTSGVSPLTVTLDGSRTHDHGAMITSWSWDFGDGTTGSGQTVTHTYSQAGAIAPSLAVTDSAGSVAFGHGTTINVAGTAPQGLASLVVSPNAVSVAIGTLQPFKAEGFDSSGRDLGDITAATAFRSSSGGNCRGAACASNRTKTYTITANAGAVSGSAHLTVTPGSAQVVSVTPNGARSIAGTTTKFHATGVDVAGNATGDLTSTTQFTIGPDGSCNANLCTATKPGPHTVTATDGTANATVALDVDVARVSGPTPAVTSVAASKTAFPAAASANAAVIAADTSGAEALAGEPLAAAAGGPLLLTRSSGLDSSVKAEIARVVPARATCYLIGPLDPRVASALQAQGYNVVTLQGADPAATAVAVADRGLANPSTILEVDQTDLTLAAAAGPAAAAIHGAILFTNGATQAPETASYLSAHPGTSRIAIGTNAGTADPGVPVVSGTDAATVAEEVAVSFFTKPPHPAIANASDITDEIIAGALGALGGDPLLLTGPNPPLPSPTAAYLHATASTIAYLDLIGTANDITANTAKALQAAIT
jgi:PKD repeat protein